jgi:hypothetical protein
VRPASEGVREHNGGSGGHLEATYRSHSRIDGCGGATKFLRRRLRAPAQVPPHVPLQQRSM